MGGRQTRARREEKDEGWEGDRVAETATGIGIYIEMDGDRARRKGWEWARGEREGKEGGPGRERETGEEQREKKYTAAIKPPDADLLSFFTMKDKAARRSLCTPPQ